MNGVIIAEVLGAVIAMVLFCLYKLLTGLSRRKEVMNGFELQARRDLTLNELLTLHAIFRNYVIKERSWIEPIQEMRIRAYIEGRIEGHRK